MFGNQFQSLVFVGAHSDALPICKHEPLMAANFLDHIFCYLGALRFGWGNITPATLHVY
jgi:hypothetical protein